MRMSHITHMPIPAPTARPFTIAITGLSICSSCLGTRWTPSQRPFLPSSAVGSPCRIRPTSPPEQNARPAPVTSTTFTPSSAWASASEPAQAVIMSAVKALSLSGRLSVIVATLALTSSRRSPMGPSLGHCRVSCHGGPRSRILPRASIDGEEAPFARDALQRVEAAVLEHQTGTRHQVLDRIRHERFAPSGQCRDAGADVHGDTTELGSHHLTLAGVEPRSDVETEPADALDDRAGGAHGPGGAVERRQESIACGVDLPTPEARELLADERMVGLQHVPPAPIAELAGLACRINDVGEHDRRQNPVGLRSPPDAGQEFLDLVEIRVRVAAEDEMIVAGQLDVLGAGDALGHVAAGPYRDGAITAAVEDQRRNPDRRQHIARVDVPVHLHEGTVGARAGARTQKVRPPLAKPRIRGHAGRACLEPDRAAPVAHGGLHDLLPF